MVERSILITLHGREVAQRFDLCTEVLMAVFSAGESIEEKRTVVLPRSSSEELCRMILEEGITTVICGGIEEEYFQFLLWKKIEVIDSVVGPWSRALELAARGRLEPGAVLVERGG